jgi:hemerythrin
MKKVNVAAGIFWVEIPEAGLYILCGCPADSVKHLKKKGLIVEEEKSGIPCETGPNAILLSDVPIQNQHFANLGEFPILQMFYKQGMILPKHPNNTGVRPLLIGKRDQVLSQAEYITRGNYGLMSQDEIESAGVSPELAREYMRIKLKFAFDSVRKTEELVDMRIVEDAKVELRNGATVERKRVNVYEFAYGGQSVTVDLNLNEKDEYEAPYYLTNHRLRREFFSVIHSGEGDGWDCNRPCMASIITYQGKIYLIDTGPNLIHSLRALGININDVEGVFQTHAHDDHFNGLTALLRSDHKIKYFSTALVRKSVLAKLSSLLTMPEEHFFHYFDVRTLQDDIWNNIDGLEVMPVYSPHPVETSVLFFRVLWNAGYKTYAHLSDTTSFRVLESMVTDNPKKSGISRSFLEKIKKVYLTAVDLKKVDIGGGLIHGDAQDYRGDESKRIILSHTSNGLTDEQKIIGSSATFGVDNVLIRGQENYLLSVAAYYLRTFFPSLPEYEIRLFLSCPFEVFNPGTILVKDGEKNADIYLIVSGVTEFIVFQHGINSKLAGGTMVGDVSGIFGSESRGTYRALSSVQAIRFSADFYVDVLKRNGLYEDAIRHIVLRNFLQDTWLFGEQITWPVRNSIASNMTRETYKKDGFFPTEAGSPLYLIEDGEAEVSSRNGLVEKIGPGDFFGEEGIIFGSSGRFKACVSKAAAVWRIPGSLISEIPVVRWKMRETFERRVRLANLY